MPKLRSLLPSFRLDVALIAAIAAMLATIVVFLATPVRCGRDAEPPRQPTEAAVSPGR